MFDPTADEIKFLWRAIDLIVQEIYASQHTGQWFRDEWGKLVAERKAAMAKEKK